MSTRLDPALDFWLRYVTARGGLAEPDGERHLAVLTRQVRTESGFDELVHVTGDPDVAREDGAVLLGPGHPALSAAADRVLADGDVGTLALDGSRPRPPDAETLLERARDQFPIDHGRIFATGSPVPASRAVLRVGALVTYSLSTDEQYQEQLEYWIDTDSRLPLSAGAARRLAGAVPLASRVSGARPAPEQLAAVLAAARDLIDEAALRRREELSTAAQRACAEERQRAEDYYAAQITALRQRLDAVPEEKKPAYETRIEATEAERARRLAEIGEKYAPAHDVRPFRAHLVQVPAVRLPAEARRGERRHELRLDYLTAAGEYAGIRCPACDAAAPFVLAKTGFGCEHCQKRPTAPAPAPAPGPNTPRTAPPAQRRAAEPTPRQPTPAASAPPPAKRAPQGPRKPPASKPAPPASRRAAQRATATDRSRRASTATQAAFALWQAVADTDRSAAEDLCDPGSPAAAAVRLYGPGGLLVCLGLPSTDRPTGAAGEPSDTWRGRRAFTGTLETRTGRRDFLLTWSDGDPPRASELMPYAAIFRFGLLGRTGRAGAANQSPPKPRMRLDQTAGHLWEIMPAHHDLHLTLRALAALWRLEDLDTYLARHAPDILAAALDRLIGYWSQAPGATYADAAARYAVPEPAVRAAGAALQKELQLSRQRPW